MDESETLAVIACRELGYSDILKGLLKAVVQLTIFLHVYISLSISLSLSPAEFTPLGVHDVTLPSIPIVWDGLQCHGNETSLLDCSRDNIHNCLNWEDAVLQCRGNLWCPLIV